MPARNRSRRIDSLHPHLAGLCRELVIRARQEGIQAIVTSTLRDEREQAALYAQGRLELDEVNALREAAGLAHIDDAGNRIVTYARRSVHEFGLAFDLAILSGGRPHWDTRKDGNANGRADYEEVGRMAEALGLTWGGRFLHPDQAHFEWTGGLTISQLEKGMRPQEQAEGKMPTGMRESGGLVDKTEQTESKRPIVQAESGELKGHTEDGMPTGIREGGGLVDKAESEGQVAQTDAITKSLSPNKFRIAAEPAAFAAGYTTEKAEMKDVKAGLKSTEFYLALLGALIPVLNAHLGLNIPMEGLMSIAGVAASYVLSRTWLKKSEAAK